MSLKQTIQSDLKESMKARATDQVTTLRMVLSEIKKREIDGKKELDDGDIQKALNTLIKQRRDSVEAFRKGDRNDLAEKEEQEILVLQKYLPEPLTEEQVAALVEEAIGEAGATGMADLGKVMPIAMAKAGGRADGKLISSLVRAKLQPPS